MEDVAMKASLDFTPLHRSGIGFDRVLDLLAGADRAGTVGAALDRRGSAAAAA
jgi:hypothetical protein